jgi:hypothetical protein
MNKTNELLKEICNLGFIISDNNLDVTCTTEVANEYYEKFYKESKHVVGSVPSVNENLSNIEYDCSFTTLENYSHLLTTQDYSVLHEIAEDNNFDILKSTLEKGPYAEGFYRDILDELTEWQLEIHDELRQIISDLTNGW